MPSSSSSWGHFSPRSVLFLLSSKTEPLTTAPAVAARFGIGKDFWLNLFLTIAGYIPGVCRTSSYGTSSSCPRRSRTQFLHTGMCSRRSYAADLTRFHDRTFGTTRHTKGRPSGPCAMALSVTPPLSATNDVHSGLGNTTIATLILATINSPWKMAKLGPRAVPRMALQITTQVTVMSCGARMMNHTTALSVRYRDRDQEDAGATRLISMIPFLEPVGPSARRRRRKTDGRGQRMHTQLLPRKRRRKSPRIAQRWGTVETWTRRIHVPNLLRNQSFQRKQQGVRMENTCEETVRWTQKMATQRHPKKTISIMSSDMLSLRARIIYSHSTQSYYICF